jgi:hypothetical protein
VVCAKALAETSVVAASAMAVTNECFMMGLFFSDNPGKSPDPIAAPTKLPAIALRQT